MIRVGWWETEDRQQSWVIQVGFHLVNLGWVHKGNMVKIEMVQMIVFNIEWLLDNQFVQFFFNLLSSLNNHLIIYFSPFLLRDFIDDDDDALDDDGDYQDKDEDEDDLSWEKVFNWSSKSRKGLVICCLKAEKNGKIWSISQLEIDSNVKKTLLEMSLIHGFMSSKAHAE